MIIEPKIRSFICTTAHPVGCATHVRQWIDYVEQRRAQQKFSQPIPKRVLVIGASTGFGLASRIVAAFGGGAQTLGVFFEKPASDRRTASAGWYNTAAFEDAAMARGLYAKSINGDAFSDEIKDQVIQHIKADWNGQVDLVIYSIASPRRVHPQTQTVFSSALKPIGESFEDKTIDVMSGHISRISLPPATDEEIQHTIAVMGGEDWRMWIDQLSIHTCLAPGFKTAAFTYIGPEITHAIYRNGTIGKAKEDLEATAKDIQAHLQAIDGEAIISVNKALVTQASAAIPVVPLYISLLYKIMKNKKTHEGCIEQMSRLFEQRLYTHAGRDSAGRIRMDDWEMAADVQAEIKQLWQQVDTDNMNTLGDLKGYLEDFHHLFGFGFDTVDYARDVDPIVPISSIPL